MPILFENDFIQVKQRFIFGSWRVVNKRSGATITPERFLMEKVGLTWPKIRLRKDIDDELRRTAENYMFFSFGMASIEPNGPVALVFRKEPPEDLAIAIILQAQAELGR